ncbi:helix-turn-helix domain-containing protein [Micromonospora rubida]|uniref:helix-turn-helix domain-containing protein n=1 Tax=Micromonospora rubida TaxID=2697657 RepID=UPI0013766720|nr:helix-turn-helix transcriptional regulator [Micromonospora rubida]NBE85239.1 DNA-binding protein [Micromonospora rubida]
MATRYVCPRCGGRLARDNSSGRCAPCQAAERDRLVAPPSLPSTFWEHQPIRRSLTERHIGWVIRAYRCHPYHGNRPLPQSVVARWVGITQAQLSRIETGTPVVHLDRLIHWARTLDIPAQHLWFHVPPSSNRGGTPAADGEQSSVEATRGDLGLHFLKSLRSTDRQVGGSYLYATIAAHLARGTDPTGRDDRSASLAPDDLAALASLNEMAGWMAHDAGNDDHARRHLGDALNVAIRSGDHHLTAQARASLSHLACHDGDPTNALVHAEAGLTLLTTVAPLHILTARLLALKARGLAMAGKVAESYQTLDNGEAALQQANGPTSEWVSPFDATSFAIEAARVFLRSGDAFEARRRLEGILVAPDAERVRSRAFARLLLVRALLGLGHVEQGCALTHQVLDQTASLGSAVIVDHLRQVSVLLGSWARQSAEVPPLLNRLRNAVRERAWIDVRV